MALGWRRRWLLLSIVSALQASKFAAEHLVLVADSGTVLLHGPHMVLQFLVFGNGFTSGQSRSGVVAACKLTLGQNLPLGCLGATLLGHQVPQLVKQLLHLRPPLALG